MSQDTSALTVQWLNRNVPEHDSELEGLDNDKLTELALRVGIITQKARDPVYIKNQLTKVIANPTSWELRTKIFLEQSLRAHRIKASGLKPKLVKTLHNHLAHTKPEDSTDTSLPSAGRESMDVGMGDGMDDGRWYGRWY